MAGPSIWWIRRDLRLSDNPALWSAAKSGAVVPLFLLDAEVERLVAAPKWRLEQGLRALSEALAVHGLRIVMRRGARRDPRGDGRDRGAGRALDAGL